MRGRTSGLLPLEIAILSAAAAFALEDNGEFHGFRVAARIKDESESPLFAGRGSLYKALDRLETRGFLSSRWEDAEFALSEGRPRRRLYRILSAGEAALSEASKAAQVAPLRKAPA